MNWLELLRAEVDATSQQAAADKIGIARTAISMALAGKYPAGTDRLAAKVREALGGVDCPHLQRRITPAECSGHRNNRSMHNPQAVAHYRACQGCKHNEVNHGAVEALRLVEQYIKQQEPK